MSPSTSLSEETVWGAATIEHPENATEKTEKLKRHDHAAFAVVTT
jgi:hypothetical protein